MQTANVNLPITVTARHMDATEALRDYVIKKIEGLHLDCPRIIEAKAILDHQKHHDRQRCEIILFCANHITIEAHTEGHDLYATIDETIAKIARRMRKHKTRLQKHARPRHKQSIRHLAEHMFPADILETHVEEKELEPSYVHAEPFKVKPLYIDEAIMDLELSDKSFVIFHNQANDKLCILHRRKDGDYGMVIPDDPYAHGHGTNGANGQS
jgi:putative sigma-54 modulation protein